MLKTYQKETKSFEFSWDMNKKECKIRKNNVPLQWLLFNGFVPMTSLKWLLAFLQLFHCIYLFAVVFASKVCLFLKKTTIFRDGRPYQKISSGHQGLLSQWEFSISCTDFFIMASQHRVLATVKNSAVNAVFSIWPIVELPTLYFPNT